MNDYQTFITEGAKNLKPMNAKELAQYAVQNIGKIICFAEKYNEYSKQGEAWYGLVIKVGDFDNPCLMLDYYGGGSAACYSVTGSLNEYNDLSIDQSEVEYIEYNIQRYFNTWSLDTVYVEIKED